MKISKEEWEHLYFTLNLLKKSAQRLSESFEQCHTINKI
ncbi:MAG: hypothetical protein KatS3mg027_0602 [Bacteroidia bacterium]|nr:MAG: hypothetical protein KatS3mg027_0602 [Bacteroidia bacterium]